MPANFVKGDILDEAKNAEDKRALVFPAQGGIVVAVNKQWPAFAEALEQAKRIEPGGVFEWRDGDLALFALGIQRADAKPKVSWIERSLKTVVERSSKDATTRILIPRLVGDWTRIKKVITEVGAKTTIDLVVFEQFIRKPTEVSGEKK